MPRLVKLTRTTPYKIEPKDFPEGGKSIWICACGLTKTPPYCDKSHKACEGEPAESLFTYEDGVRREASPGDTLSAQAPLS
jgi:CDGSH-type Zn-finger protein